MVPDGQVVLLNKMIRVSLMDNEMEEEKFERNVDLSQVVTGVFWYLKVEHSCETFCRPKWHKVKEVSINYEEKISDILRPSK